MNVILIDDEQHALDLLEFHINSNFSDVQILGKFQNPSKALLYLKTNTPDLIFMDIDMPGLNGIETKTLIEKQQIPVVFVTAHESYAVEAIKIDAFDYLLKPINVEELQRVYNKFKMSISKPTDGFDKIEFKIATRHVIAKKDEVLFVSSEGNYSTVHFTDRSDLMITKNMKKMIEEYFLDEIFFRVHRSFLVNLNHVVEFNHHEVILSGNKTVSLARNSIEELKMVMRDR